MLSRRPLHTKIRMHPSNLQPGNLFAGAREVSAGLGRHHGPIGLLISNRAGLVSDEVVMSTHGPFANNSRLSHVEPKIEDRCAVGQPADRDEIDASRGNAGDGRQS